MNAKLPPNIPDLKPRITVIGVGGAGCNAVNNMIDASLDGVDFVVANTDAQSLVASNAPHKIQLGARLTEGLGAGSRPDIGEAAAIETLEEIRDLVRGSHMVFVAAGMGGGTGTGAAAVIARAAKEQNILTVAVVTKPFQFEGARRMRIAEAGIAELKKHVDTLIVIPNQNLFRIASERTTFAEAFVLADQVLYSGVACIVDLIVKEGLINLDFADVRTVMSGMGSAMMGTGEASGEGRAVRAAEEAITNPLLDDVTLAGAKGLLLSITGGTDLTLYEVDEAATRVRQEVDPEANIIVGATYDPTLGDRVRVSIVASGMDRSAAAQPPARPAPMTQSHGSHPGVADPPPAAQDRLADALKSPAFEELTRASAPSPAHSPAEAAHHPAAPIAAAYPPSAPSNWHSGDDVEITDLPPGALTPGAPSVAYAPPAIDYGPAIAPVQPAMDPYAPAPPAQVRRPPRRMPELEEFPVVGQRVYQAKTQRNGPAPHVYAEPTVRAPEPKKRGFFERLTGRAKREGDSHASSRDREAFDTANRSESDRSYTVGGDADPRRSGWLESEPQRQEKPELPVFFSKSRR
ncbi:MAG: cell division protein FtsZ [Hyphomicrobium sp. 32-62-53]|nr:MAG: cell division protein FtsZ [Hyphomicrobium sp. 12-62-95]OYY01644.1 MAG: cell division protein FtsZ [Hyphomicrobium sp. 32-62-53]